MARYWGDRRDSAIEAPPCEEQPASGRPLVIGRRNRQATAARSLDGRGIAGGAIETGHLSQVLLDMIFAGGGRDGEADFDGTSTVYGIVPSGGIYVLNRDISATRLHVRNGVTIRPFGFKLFAREGHLYGDATITGTGGVGSNATGPAAGGKGDPLVTESGAVILGGGESGGAGGKGGETASEAGAAGQPGEAILVGLGGDGAAGIAGETIGGGGAGGPLGAAGTVGGTQATTATLDNFTRLMRGPSLISGGAGGGGGGGGGATAAGVDGGGGGGGGAGGHVVLVAFGRLVLHSWTGSIQSNGGKGGNGAAGAGAAGDGGQGGGGGGGVVHLLYGAIEGGPIVPMMFARNSTPTQAQQDAAGANVTAWGGRLGTNGSGVAPTPSALIAPCGTVVVIGPEAYVPSSEIPAFSAPPRRPIRKRLSAGHYIAMKHKHPLE